MKASLFFFLGLAIIVNCMGLDCPECDTRTCKDPDPPCRRGKTLDVCGCCSVCLRGIGEDCGGPWGIHGQCAGRLSCIRMPIGAIDPIGDFNAKGRCLALP